MIKTSYNEIRPYQTKDGSVIRELLHPNTQGRELTQSLAEATVPPGFTTFRHYHRYFSEIYHVTQGQGTIVVGDETRELSEGDSIYIPPMTPHSVTNTGTSDLRILCICAPPYTHAATVLLEGEGTDVCLP